ncbi:unnamed protein product [Prorocentrum cordatum]|uniref:Uncharacterized protein n=1 Tax=Prorocentrum cordatum TaxID=2364126 RepID=A0ABN9PFX3_9DINO|nr:unnamed protein product [Polarella glacialis]
MAPQLRRVAVGGGAAMSSTEDPAVSRFRGRSWVEPSEEDAAEPGRAGSTFGRPARRAPIASSATWSTNVLASGGGNESNGRPQAEESRDIEMEKRQALQREVQHLQALVKAECDAKLRARLVPR